jgi:hypothetical protein
MKNFKTDPVKTVLTISVGFIVVYLLSKWRWALSVSLIVGLIGIFSPYLSRKVEFLWMKLTWLLSLILPNILLGIIFYLFLFPISLLSKLFRKKDILLLKNNYSTTFKETNKTFDKVSFEKPW